MTEVARTLVKFTENNGNTSSNATADSIAELVVRVSMTLSTISIKLNTVVCVIKKQPFNLSINLLYFYWNQLDLRTTITTYNHAVYYSQSVSGLAMN